MLEREKVIVGGTQLIGSAQCRGGRKEILMVLQSVEDMIFIFT